MLNNQPQDGQFILQILKRIMYSIKLQFIVPLRVITSCNKRHSKTCQKNLANQLGVNKSLIKRSTLSMNGGREEIHNKTTFWKKYFQRNAYIPCS